MISAAVILRSKGIVQGCASLSMSFPARKALSATTSPPGGGAVNTSPVLMNAGGVLAVLPPLLLALIFQRLIVSGITAGAMKG